MMYPNISDKTPIVLDQRPPLKSDPSSSIPEHVTSIAGTSSYVATENKLDNQLAAVLDYKFMSSREVTFFEERYKDLLASLSAEKNLEVNKMLRCHVMDIAKLAKFQGLFFNISHQQFIVNLCNNPPKYLYNNLKINECLLQKLLDKIYLLVQKAIISQNEIYKKSDSTFAAVQPIWLWKKNKIVYIESLLKLSDDEITQIVSLENIDSLMIKKFSGAGYDAVMRYIRAKDSNSGNLKRKNNNKCPDSIFAKKIKKNNLAENCVTEKQKNINILLDNHQAKIDKFCIDNNIIFSQMHKSFIAYLRNHTPQIFYNGNQQLLFAELLDKLFLVIQKSVKSNGISATVNFINPIFSRTNYFIKLKTLLNLSSDDIIQLATNKNFIRNIISNKYARRGYPSIEEVIKNN